MPARIDCTAEGASMESWGMFGNTSGHNFVPAQAVQVQHCNIMNVEHCNIYRALSTSVRQKSGTFYSDL